MRCIDADKIPRHGKRGGECYWQEIKQLPTADVVEAGKWCNMREYILELQADENGHNEFFRIIKLPVIFSNDELEACMEYGITEAAVRLGMKARTVREWIRNGKIKAHKNTSGKWVIMENEIGRIIEEKYNKII